MSRRPSHASVTGLRRQSLAAGQGKRVSLKDGTLGAMGLNRLNALAEIKEGDTFYRTERIYPSIPDYPEDVTVSVARWQREPRSGSTMSTSRDDVSTPSDNSPSYERDR